MCLIDNNTDVPESFDDFWFHKSGVGGDNIFNKKAQTQFKEILDEIAKKKKWGSNKKKVKGI